MRLGKISIPFFLLLSIILIILYRGTWVQSQYNSDVGSYIYRYPLRYEVDTLDPARTQGIASKIVINQIFDGLVRFDKEMNILPAIARSWRISDNGRLYTFYLRKGVRFHNGREVTAKDVVYSIERLARTAISPASKERIRLLSIVGGDAYLSGRSGHISGLRAINDYTVEIRLESPFAPTLSILGIVDTSIVPEEEVERGGFGRHPVGTGPFRFVGWRGREIMLERNPDYYLGSPSIDTLVFRAYPGPDDSGILGDLLKGRLENAVIPLNIGIKSLRERGFKIIKRPGTKIHFYAFNTRLIPFNNKKVRQAIAYAIDRERIVKEAVNGRFILARGITPPGILGYNPSINGYDYNPDKARQLLNEAGYADGRGLPEIEFWTASSSPAAKKELEIVRENLSSIGIRMKVRYAPWHEFEKRFSKGRLPIFRLAFQLDFPDPEALYGYLFDSRGVNNYTFYKNPVVDRLLAEGRKEMDVIKRAEIYREVERIVLDDLPAIPLLFYTYEQALQPYVRGFEPNPLGEIYINMERVWMER